MLVEYYSHVMHIVSNVEGKLNQKKIFKYVMSFSCRNCIWCPKIRAMEIINNLENSSRGIYGVRRIFSGNGDMKPVLY